MNAKKFWLQLIDFWHQHHGNLEVYVKDSKGNRCEPWITFSLPENKLAPTIAVLHAEHEAPPKEFP